MPSDAAIYLSVEREWVESGDISTVLHALETMESGLLASGRNCVTFFTHGYDDDARELYDIPEVRDWYQKLFNSHPGLFYWLDAENKMFMLFGLLLFRPIRVDGKVALNAEDLKAYLTIGFSGLNQFCQRNGVSTEPTNEVVFRFFDIQPGPRP